MLLLYLAFLVLVPYAAIHTVNNDTRTKALARWDDNASREQRNHSSIAVILGEFRANFSDLMFVKTERYLHSGVGYKPHLDTDAMAATGKITHRTTSEHRTTSKPLSAPSLDHQIANPTMVETATIPVGQTKIEDEEDGHEHHGDGEVVATIIRTKGNDFRGFLGDLEREIKPWRDPSLPHQHTAGTELLPWFRLATLGNPQNERAYMIGTWWLKTLATEEQRLEGLKFIEEGIANNPNSFALQLSRGYLLRDLKRNKEAHQAFMKAAELLFLERPPNGQITRDWTVSREEMAVGAMTMAILTTRDEVGTTAALELARSLHHRSQAQPIERILHALEKEVAAAGGHTGASSNPSLVGQ
jgi:hypothetical protein